jgi:hypothetical protein
MQDHLREFEVPLFIISVITTLSGLDHLAPLGEVRLDRSAAVEKLSNDLDHIE